MKKLYKIDNPRVGLLSNGSEPTKGNHLVKETYPLLAKEEDIVLFSPASRSENRKENFEKRGNRFVESVKALEHERHQ